MPLEQSVSPEAAGLMAQAGRAMPAIDSLLAATAFTHRLTLVTRNERDFQHHGLDIINPWESAHP